MRIAKNEPRKTWDSGTEKYKRRKGLTTDEIV